MSLLYRACPSCKGPVRRENCLRCGGVRFIAVGLSTDDVMQLRMDVFLLRAELEELKAETKANRDTAGSPWSVRSITRPPLTEVTDDDGEIERWCP
mgnify:CR=1 FL=1